MSCKRRCISPMSENSILKQVQETYDNTIEESDLGEILSSSESDLDLDDSDLDPTFDPNTPESTKFRNRLSPPDPNNVSESDSDSDSDCQPTTITESEPLIRSRPRGRPKGSTLIENEVGLSSSEKWVNVEENSDVGYTHNFGYHEIPGPKHCPPPESPPISYFFLFFTVNLINTIIKETNRYAEEYVTTHKPGAIWKKVNFVEMKAFLAVILNMGITKKPNLKLYWSTTSSQSTPWFPNMFSRTRFEALLKFFHIVNNNDLAKHGTPDYDPCGKFQPLIDHINIVFHQHYTPNKNISIDESLIGTKNHTQLLQYMPNKKHHKWGIKLWVLCDSVTKYCLGLHCYKGAKNSTEQKEIKEKGLAHVVIVKLLQIGNYLNKGYHLFVDNFFTSISLAQYLYSKLTFLTGTIRKNRLGIPDGFLGKYKVGDKKYLRKNEMLGLAYKEKQSQKSQVILISTDSTAETVQRSKTRHNRLIVKTKPKIIDQYNQNMGGIDCTDQMLYAYLDERRTVKYWRKVTFNIFARMVLNAYILYKLNCNEKPMSRLQFTISIIDTLAEGWLTTKNIPEEMVVGGNGSGDAPSGTFGLGKLSEKKEKNCIVCSTKEKRKRSRTFCVKCKKGVHGECFTKHKCS